MTSAANLFPDLEPSKGAPGHVRILMAPWNFADQPMSLTRAMRSRGHYVRQIQYATSGEHALGYDLDSVVKLRYTDTEAQFRVLEACLDEQFHIYHFWQRSLVFNQALSGLTGIDLPVLKAHGATLFHRFTGFDLRLPQADKALNPHSPYHEGYEAPFDEDRQRRYIDYLREYVDVFLVQDPEMRQFMPDAHVIPRGLNLADWRPVGVRPNPRPLIVHAPTSPLVKGSNYVASALDELSAEGLDFEYKQLLRLPYTEAREWYERADIIIDQILIGATGVLTLEAWALGKPCVTFLRKDLFEPFYQTSDLPVANATPENVKPVLRELIRDYEWRQDLARRGRQTVERFHDINVVASDYEALCRQVLGEVPAARGSAAAIRFVVDGLGTARVGAAEPRSFKLGLAERYPRLASLAGGYFSAQERAFEALVRLQMVVLRSLFIAALTFTGRRSTGTAPESAKTARGRSGE